jgi:hypothetical protein
MQLAKFILLVGKGGRVTFTNVLFFGTRNLELDGVSQVIRETRNTFLLLVKHGKTRITSCSERKGK